MDKENLNDKTIEGKIFLEFSGCCDDFINILLANGYTLSMQLIDNNKYLQILYLKQY